MAFQVKDFVSITASMINWMKATTKRVTDFNVGSVVRTMLEAVAAEIDELYQQFFIGTREAIPVATYNSFDFDKLPAISAGGVIRVTVTPSATIEVIAAGTTASAVGLSTTYSVAQDISIPIGASYVDIAVSADEAGTVGNIAAGQDFDLNPAPNSFISATNLSAFASGQDEETDDEQKIRFTAYIASLSRATNAALKYGLSTASITDGLGNIIESVAASAVVEPYKDDPNQPIALVECYIHNGIGGTSAALVAQATKIVEGYHENGVAVPGYKAAGVKTTVAAAGEKLVPVTGLLVADDGYDHDTLAASASATVFAYIQSLDIGEECLFSEIIRVVKDLDGVYDFNLTAPAANVPATNKQKLMPGAINIT